jgi:hypothetical protein
VAVAGSVWDEVPDTEHAVVVRTYIEQWPRKDRTPEKVLIIVVEPDDETRNRCPECGQRGRPAGCPRHGKITAAVPWARHDDRFSRPFEEFAAWKAAHMPWTRAAAELRITWEAPANITARVAADAAAGRDRLDGLRCQATVEAFFSDLGEERAGLLTHVSAGGADWIHPAAREKAPQAKLCLDAFHVVKWAGEKPDDLRRRTAAELRTAGRGDEAATLGTEMRAGGGMVEQARNRNDRESAALLARRYMERPLRGDETWDDRAQAFRAGWGIACDPGEPPQYGAPALGWLSRIHEPACSRQVRRARQGVRRLRLSLR